MRMKKGVSPVIAVLLMIAITVAIGILVYVWVSGLAGSMTSGGGTQVAEQLELIAYDFHDTNTLILYVKNTGGIAVTIDRIYFGTSGGTFTVTTSFTTSGDFTDSTLNPGGVGSITISTGGATAGAAYIVKVVTESGAVFSWTVVAGRTG